MLTILLLTQALWTAKCTGLTCTFDGRASTGAISRSSWTFGDGTPPSVGTVVGHTFAQAGTFDVRLTVYDSVLKKSYYTTKHFTVKAAVAQPVRVDTLRLPYAVHDTVFVPKVDTEYVVRTAWLHDTAMVVIAAPPNIVHLDSLQSPYVWPVYRSEVIGHVKRRDGKYEAWTFTACPASMTPPAPLKLAFTCTVPAWTFAALDSAIARIVNP